MGRHRILMARSLPALVVAGAVLAGCAAEGTGGTASDIAVEELFPVSLHRTGGFAGVDHYVEVAADGSVEVAQDGHRSAAGRLDESDLDRLRSAVAGLVVSNPQETAGDAGGIIDGFQYDVEVAGRRWTVHEDTTNAPAVAAVLSELEPLLPGG